MLMKRILFIMFVLVSVLPAAGQKKGPAKGVSSQYGVSFTKGVNMPDAYYFLPAPPKRGDAQWAVDSVMYVRGKQLRSTPRGREAVADAETSVQYFMDKIGAVMGRKLTEQSHPQLAILIRGTLGDIRGSIQKAKNKFARHRPYQVFGEPTPVPEDESPTDFTSYPSGHTVRAWGLALLMTTIDPVHSNEYMRMGYELGESRVIVGFHFESDVEAARLAASAGYARLCAEKSFLRQIEKARKELFSR